MQFETLTPAAAALLTQVTKIIEELLQHAKTCETVAQDKTQEALTGASADNEKNTREAREWMIQSKVWLEAEALVRGVIQPTPLMECGIAVPAQRTEA